MFTGFPSTQTPAVEWWDFSKAYSGTRRLALANDCAPIQYFATGGTSTAIQLTLPQNPSQGKTITFKNDRLRAVTQNINILDSAGNTVVELGQSASVTICYIAQNTLSATTAFSNWVVISGGCGVNSANPGAVVLGGSGSSATGTGSASIGGSSCIASGGANASTFGGTSADAQGANSVVLGGSGVAATGTNSGTVGGSSNTASASAATTLGGTNNTASGSNSTVLGGGYATTRGIEGAVTLPGCNAPITTTAGVSQSRLMVLARQTTDATATVLASNASAAGTTNQVILPNNSAFYFRGEVICGVTGAGDTKGFFIEGAIKRGANAASTVLVGTPTVTSSYADAGASTWALTATADVTNGGLAITVTGQAATTIRWVAKIFTTEMTY
jgi:hypothetical protein